MNIDSTSIIDSLEDKISIFGIIGIIALIITLFGASFSWVFAKKLNVELKKQRRQDQLEILRANEKADSATVEAENAKKDAALAFEKAAESNERASKAELRSKELEVELLKLRLAVGDRYLPESVADVLRSELKKYSKKTILIYCVVSNDSEPLDFSKNLQAFFNSIGWKTNIIEQNNVMIPAPTGILVVAIGESNQKLGKFICEQFKSIEYECYESLAREGDADLLIFVRAH